MSAARLALARSVAWALLFGGWLALGALGRQLLPLWAAGQVPVALWLAAIGALLAVMRQRTIDAAVLRAALVGAGLLTAFALAAVSHGGGVAALLLAAAAWAALLVTVSFGVRSLRLAQAHTPAAPLAPALAGAVLAWAVTGDLGGVGASTDLAALAVAGAALLAAWLTPRRGPALRGCRSGLFDCSLPMPARRAWRDTADWPLQAATLAMLPMMAAMPVMIEWCGAAFATLPAHGVALHLGAMLLPALCLRRPLQGIGRVALRAVVGLLMLAGAVALLSWPGLAGLTVAALLQAAAWSLAWAGPMLARENTAPRSAPVPLPALPQTTGVASTASQAALTAVAVLLLGVAIAAAGPAALVAVHAALAGLALAGPAWSGIRQVISLPSTKELHS